ncbi:unnamed protein product [Dicrocoelium dendriticum]|nr:unnamed protein product [Dicrocoelium dendriticum]
MAGPHERYGPPAVTTKPRTRPLRNGGGGRRRTAPGTAPPRRGTTERPPTPKKRRGTRACLCYLAGFAISDRAARPNAPGDTAEAARRGGNSAGRKKNEWDASGAEKSGPPGRTAEGVPRSPADARPPGDWGTAAPGRAAIPAGDPGLDRGRFKAEY